MPSSKKDVENNQEMTPEMRNRYSLMLSMGLNIVNRLDSTISALNSRIGTLLGFSFSILSINLAIIGLFFQQNYTFSIYTIGLFLSFFILLAVTIIICIIIFYPVEYKDIDIFTDKRFKILSSASEFEINKDFLFHIKKIFLFNEEIHLNRIRKFVCALQIFSISFIIQIIAIISIAF